MLIKCPKCGREISDKAKRCVECGWIPEKITVAEIENYTAEKSEIRNKSNESEDQNIHIQKDEQKSTSQKNVMLNKMKKVLLIGTCIFGIAAIIFFSRANNVKNEYYNSEDYYSLNKNAYVGGDAYNYIINGTYFTGYSVIGAGCMICAVIMGTNFVTLKIKEGEE